MIAEITTTQWSIASVIVVQAFLFAKIWLTDKRKANESHVKSVEKAQDRLYVELELMRKDMRELQVKLDVLQARYEVCVTNLSASLTRLELLEEFRNIAERDNPTGKTLEAMPPSR